MPFWTEDENNKELTVEQRVQKLYLQIVNGGTGKELTNEYNTAYAQWMEDRAAHGDGFAISLGYGRKA
jgi:hypothetical protein